MNWIRRAAIMIGLAAAFTAPAFMTSAAASASPVVGGQFCSEGEHGMVKQDAKGVWRQCRQIGSSHIWRWSAQPVPAPSRSHCPTVKPSKSVSVSPSATVTVTATVVAPAYVPSCPTATATTTTSAPVTPNPVPTQQAGLPTTGAPVKSLIIGGVLLLALGAGAVIWARQRRTDFVA